MSMRAGIAADSAAALLFRILSQPALLFPPLRQVDGIEVQHQPLGGYISSERKQVPHLLKAQNGCILDIILFVKLFVHFNQQLHIIFSNVNCLQQKLQ